MIDFKNVPSGEKMPSWLDKEEIIRCDEGGQTVSWAITPQHFILNSNVSLDTVYILHRIVTFCMFSPIRSNIKHMKCRREIHLLITSLCLCVCSANAAAVPVDGSERNKNDSWLNVFAHTQTSFGVEYTTDGYSQSSQPHVGVVTDKCSLARPDP